MHNLLFILGIFYYLKKQLFFKKLAIILIQENLRTLLFALDHWL